MLDFWFDFASTYSYPAAMRIRRLADEAGIAVRFRPFLLGPIFKHKAGRLRRSICLRQRARTCGAISNASAPMQVCRSGGQNLFLKTACWRPGWHWSVWPERGAKRSVLRYSKRNLAKADQSPMPMRLPTSFCALTLRPRKRWPRQHRTITSSDCVHRPKRRSVLGVFGAPTFIAADGELFWGNDRLERALLWAKQRS